MRGDLDILSRNIHDEQVLDEISKQILQIFVRSPHHTQHQNQSQQTTVTIAVQSIHRDEVVIPSSYIVVVRNDTRIHNVHIDISKDLTYTTFPNRYQYFLVFFSSEMRPASLCTTQAHPRLCIRATCLWRCTTSHHSAGNWNNTAAISIAVAAICLSRLCAHWLLDRGGGRRG